MKFLKKPDAVLPILLAVIVALYPETFKDTGHLLLRYKTEALLILITVILIYICKQCSVIKRQTQDKKRDTKT